MRILVLGGTAFVGRAVVEDALAAGHELTLFGRGRTGTDLFPDVPRRTGDRDSGDYASLAEGEWDAVVDVSAYVPRHVAQASEAVRDRAGRYLFISTGSVYDREQAPADGLDETAARLAPERGTETVDGATYGPLKVACEDEAAQRWGDALTVVRPGIVGGPHDPTDRFTYWARRAARGGRVAVPGRLDQPVQVVDARDLARLVVSLLEADTGGTFNAVGPAVPLADLVRACAGGADVEPVQVEDRLGFPLVLPDASWDVMFRRSAARAHAAGMPVTPYATTAEDVRAWDAERGTPPLSVGMTEDEERALLG